VPRRIYTSRIPREGRRRHPSVSRSVEDRKRKKGATEDLPFPTKAAPVFLEAIEGGEEGEGIRLSLIRRIGEEGGRFFISSPRAFDI